MIEVDGANMKVASTTTKKHRIFPAKMSRDIMNEIVNGRMTFQRAFMEGKMKSKGDFKILRTLDLISVLKNSDKEAAIWLKKIVFFVRSLTAAYRQRQFK